MKIALLADQHFSVRKGNKLYFEYYRNFYENIFFPYLIENNINLVIDLGDTFDNRKSIDFLSLNQSKKMYFDVLAKNNIFLIMIVGNHTSFYKNTNDLNSPEVLLSEYKNIKVIKEIEDLKIANLKATFLPWINQENEEKVFEHIKTTDANILFGHLELNGFVAHPGHIYEGGYDKDLFFKYKKVLSGHFHHKSTIGNVTYLGNPYQLYWNDYKEKRGFHILDTETLQLEFIENTYTLFEKIYYDDSTTDYTNFDFSNYKNKFIKVFVQNKNNEYLFDKFLETFYDIGIHELKVIEDKKTEQVDIDINIEGEDTLTTLNSFIDDIEYVDKNSIKNKIKSLYLEALELV